MPKRGWKWMRVWRQFGVWVARSSDGQWEYKGAPVGRVSLMRQRLESGRHVFRAAIGEFAGAIVFDHGRFR